MSESWQVDSRVVTGVAGACGDPKYDAPGGWVDATRAEVKSTGCGPVQGVSLSAGPERRWSSDHVPN